MPINLIHQWLHSVEKGWDPVSSKYAREYEEHASCELNADLIERLAVLCGGLRNKKILDLGGGPGHYSVLLAQAGAEVTWHDPSREYQKIAASRARSAGVCIEFSLGYLEEAQKLGTDAFDLVFCRVCWYYARGDRSFARLLYGLVKSGGIGYIDCNVGIPTRASFLRKLQFWCNRHLWLKIGHPFPPHGRIAKLIQGKPTKFLETDYRSPGKDAVIFMKL